MNPKPHIVNKTCTKIEARDVRLRAAEAGDCDMPRRRLGDKSWVMGVVFEDLHRQQCYNVVPSLKVNYPV